MATIGIELCNAGFQAALCEQKDPRLLAPGGRTGILDWPGYAYHDGKKFWFGRAAEDVWFVEPRQVCHVFWNKLSHEPSTLTVAGKPPSFSELAFYFLRDFTEQLAAAAGPLEKVGRAVPSAYLKDAATEGESIGLRLGLARGERPTLSGAGAKAGRRADARRGRPGGGRGHGGESGQSDRAPRGAADGAHRLPARPGIPAARRRLHALVAAPRGRRGLRRRPDWGGSAAGAQGT